LGRVLDSGAAEYVTDVLYMVDFVPKLYTHTRNDLFAGISIQNETNKYMIPLFEPTWQTVFGVAFDGAL
jgi:hypothetical protein